MSAGLKPSAKHTPKLTTIRDPCTGKLTQDPTEMLDIATIHLANELKRLTSDTLPAPPWTIPNNPDNFVLENPTITQPLPSVDQTLTKGHYTTALARTSIGKAPGPDTIPNEIIKYLPEEVHDLIYSLFRLMAQLRYTPATWCSSATCLLFKPHKTTHTPSQIIDL